ncbi:hypothetical protein MTR_5g024120 [Medicago truncatula]|uniref:F-box domain-containing protein n=1 Tax=Medicago truncatula TaxID=3880 RepID=G7K174_MEDTR|nr:hypothetical protein MTR_5g024120 [Medicago truncatula]
MKRCKKLKSELPDSIISYIFFKLALKDLVKTSALSKRWVHEWGLRTDLNFDLHTMFDYNTIQVPNTFPLFQRLHFQSEFVTRLDQFMLHYKGAIIHSIRVKFPLVNPQHGDYTQSTFKLICYPSLALEVLNFLNLLGFSECLQLEDVTFKNFRHMSSIEIITSPKLRHLKIIDCGWADCSPSEIAIDAFNLSSFEYSAHILRIISITAPKLLKVFWNASPGRKTPHLLDPIARLSHIENLSMIILTSQIRNLHREHSHIVGFKRQKREYTGFSHNDLKHVEFHGCVGSINVIDSRDKAYIGVGRWTRDANDRRRRTIFCGGGGCRWFGENVIHEMFKDEVNEQCQLIIL